jgi:N-acetylglutamate synthase-like GNAT family acetyltransferase
MYVRDARNRDEAWLLDQIEAMSLDDVAFRSRDYVIAVDEESDQKAGFGRYRVHKTDDGAVCELTGIGVLESWRGQGVGAHVIERLVDTAAAEGFETVYTITDSAAFLEQFGFERIDPSTEGVPEIIADRVEQKRDTVGDDVVTLALAIDAFEMPDRLRERFKTAAEAAADPEPEETAEDFGIDPEKATYKYDTGR